MRIAIPVTNGRLSLHFGHAEAFALADVDEEAKNILGIRFLAAPDHQPGMLPAWLQGKGADIIIAGGMGMRAQNLFADHGLTVVVGAVGETPETIVTAYLDGKLETGGNICDH